MPSTFQLGERYDQLLDDLVASGDYSNKSEAMRDALRKLERDRAQWAAVLEGHRAAPSDDASLVPADQAFARIRSRFITTGSNNETNKTTRKKSV